MKLFTCTKFTGYWPVGSAAVIVATDAHHAAWLLNQALVLVKKLPGDAVAKDMVEMSLAEPSVAILCDGYY